MGTTERFTRREVQRILDVTEKQVDYWERLGLVSPRKGRGKKAASIRRRCIVLASRAHLSR